MDEILTSKQLVMFLMFLILVSMLIDNCVFYLLSDVKTSVESLTSYIRTEYRGKRISMRRTRGTGSSGNQRKALDV